MMEIIGYDNYRILVKYKGVGFCRLCTDSGEINWNQLINHDSRVFISSSRLEELYQNELKSIERDQKLEELGI